MLEVDQNSSIGGRRASRGAEFFLEMLANYAALPGAAQAGLANTRKYYVISRAS